MILQGQCLMFLNVENLKIWNKIPTKYGKWGKVLVLL